MLRVDLAYIIRHKVLVEGKSRRAVADELGVSRNTVRKYVEAADPQPRRTESSPRPAPLREKAESRIRELLEEWRQDTTKKQRVTVDARPRRCRPRRSSCRLGEVITGQAHRVREFASSLSLK